MGLVILFHTSAVESMHSASGVTLYRHHAWDRKWDPMLSCSVIQVHVIKGRLLLKVHTMASYLLT